MKVIVQKSENAIKVFHILANLTIKNIINFLIEKGPNPPSVIAREINISASTASRCLQEMKKYNIVKAKWKMISVDDRPLKVYTLVPNVLRFEYVVNEPKTNIKRDHAIKFTGNKISEFKEGNEKSMYVSLESIPFRFDGQEAEILKEVAKGGYSFSVLKKKFKEVEEFDNILRKFLRFGLIEIIKEEK